MSYAVRTGVFPLGFQPFAGFDIFLRKVYNISQEQNGAARRPKERTLEEMVFAAVPPAEYGALEGEIARLSALGFGDLPVCMAKTQYSFSDDAKKLGAPEGFTVTVRTVKVSAGAGVLVALTGNILTMPGLPKVPSAENIDVTEDGRIVGLF